MSLLGFADLRLRPDESVHFDDTGDLAYVLQRLAELLELAEGDVCLVLDSQGLALAEAAVAHHFQAHADASFTVSLVRVKPSDEEDLLGKKAGSISGMPVANSESAIHTLKLSQICSDQTRDYVATVKRILGALQHSLPARLLHKCQPIMIVGNASSLRLAQEWRRVFAVDPIGRIRDLERQLQEAQERIALRENTLVNVLLGSHPAFDGLSDARAKADAKKQGASSRGGGGKENATNDVVTAKVASALSTVEFQDVPLKRMASTAGGALRVVKTPGANTPKTKSRIF